MTKGMFIAIAIGVFALVFAISGYKTYKEEKAKEKASAKVKKKDEEE